MKQRRDLIDSRSTSEQRNITPSKDAHDPTLNRNLNDEILCVFVLVV